MKKILMFVMLWLSCLSASQAELVFSAPPRESEVAGEDYYGPLIEFLSKVLGDTIVYAHPDNWVQYARDMRDGRYDIVFDGPHFAAWRMKKTDHVPLVRLSGQLAFVVVARSNNDKIKSIESLIGRNICGLASPNLGTVAVFALFSNPVNQPMMVNIKGSPNNVLDTFLNTDQCVAAVVRDSLYNALPQEKKQLLKIVARSQAMPNQTLTISAKALKNRHDAVTKALLSAEGALAADGIFTRFSKNTKFFVPAAPTDYTDLEYLLEGVVYGW